MTRCATSRPRCAFPPPTPGFDRLPSIHTFHLSLSLSFSQKMTNCRTVSDPRCALSTATPPLAPHSRRAAPPRQDTAGILARHARRASAACRDDDDDDDKEQGRSRLITVAHRSTRTMVTLLGRRAAYRRRGRRRDTDAGAQHSTGQLLSCPPSTSPLI